MKKLLITITIVAVLIACGGSDGNKLPSTNGANNDTQNGASKGNNPCGEPVADDGSKPTPLPVCSSL